MFTCIQGIGMASRRTEKAKFRFTDNIILLDENIIWVGYDDVLITKPNKLSSSDINK
jgi:hypothetical protein